MRRGLGSAGLILGLLAGVARGEPPPDAPCAEPPAVKLHVPDPCHTFARAGWPNEVACYARPSYSAHDCGYYVGGGAACGGEPRRIDEGTWGWDYCGCLLPHKVFLCWWHGRRCQGGTGAYRTDGPHFPGEVHMPKVFHRHEEAPEGHP
jgi:hypothetical protein